MAKTWKAGRGKLGFLKPYEGQWFAEGDSPMGPYRVTRTLRPIQGKGWLAMDVSWRFGSDEKGKAYEEHAVIGTDHDGTVRFWSFTSDGKRSEGTLADLKDLHPEAISFHAEMPAGLARMAYWPEGESFMWAVEAQTKKRWRRMVEHRYRPL